MNKEDFVKIFIKEFDDDEKHWKEDMEEKLIAAFVLIKDLLWSDEVVFENKDITMKDKDEQHIWFVDTENTFEDSSCLNEDPKELDIMNEGESDNCMIE